jgi:hypothetical protein
LETIMTPSKTKPKDAVTVDTPVCAAPLDRVNRIAPLLKQHGQRRLLPDYGSASQMKNALKQFTARLKDNKRKATVDAISTELESRSDVKDALTVADTFRNLPAGTGVAVANLADPVAAVKAIVGKYGDDFKLSEIGLTKPLDPETQNPKAPRPVDEIADYIAKQAVKGIGIGVQACTRTGTYVELIDRNIDRPLLSSGPGFDAVQAWCQWVYRADKDPNMATAHPVVGAAVGKRIALNARYGPGEPMAGHRNEGDGAKGGFDCGIVAQQYGEDDRNELAKWGINTVREWRTVGPVIGVCNRSLQAGNGIYIYASTVRQRQQIQAAFHATAEHNIWHSGKRDDASLEKTLLAMKRMLDDIKARKYLEKGDVKIDRKSQKILLINVLCRPAEPVDRIELSYYVNESH